MVVAGGAVAPGPVLQVTHGGGGMFDGGSRGGPAGALAYGTAARRCTATNPAGTRLPREYMRCRYALSYVHCSCDDDASV